MILSKASTAVNKSRVFKEFHSAEISLYTVLGTNAKITRNENVGKKRKNFNQFFVEFLFYQDGQ